MSWKDLSESKTQIPPFLCHPYVPEGGIILLHGKWSSGKCFAPGTLVLMADGSTERVESIKPGDLVMGPDSTPRKVLECHSGVDDMYEVRPSVGEPWRCNSKHLITYKDNGKLKDTPASELKVGSNMTLVRVPVEFPAGDPLPVDPYLLGLILGDGYIENGVQITNTEPEVREYIHKAAASLDMRVTYKGKYTLSMVRRAGAGYPTGELRSKGRTACVRNPLLASLRALGLGGKRAGDKFIPSQYLVASREDRLQLLAGLADSDGYCKNQSITFTQKSLALCSDIAYLAGSLGLRVGRITPVTRRCQTGAIGTYYTIHIGLTCLVPVKVARKMGRLSQRPGIGFTIEPIGVGEYYGFSVDGDHRFLLSDFTLVHNSPLTWELARCIGEGRDFFGHPTRKARVLYIEVDTPMALVKDRVDKLPPAENVWFAFLSSFNVVDLSREEVDKFKELQALGPELVIINTLRKVHHLDDTKSSTPNLVYSSFQKLFPQSALLFVHHDKKESQDPKAKYVSSEAFSGSMHWADDIQVSLHLRKIGKNLSLEHTKSQVSECLEPIALELDADGSHIYRHGERQKEATLLLKDKLSSLPAREADKILAEELGVSDRTARKWRLLEN